MWPSRYLLDFIDSFEQQSFDALSQISYNDDEDSGKGGLSNAYSAIYIGLILSKSLDSKFIFKLKILTN